MIYIHPVGYEFKFMAKQNVSPEKEHLLSYTSVKYYGAWNGTRGIYSWHLIQELAIKMAAGLT